MYICIYVYMYICIYVYMYVKKKMLSLIAANTTATPKLSYALMGAANRQHTITYKLNCWVYCQCLH